jgi:O-antigen ligase
VLLCYAWDAPKILDGSIDDRSTAGAEAGDTLRQIAFLALFAGAVGIRLFARHARSRIPLPAIFVPILAWCWASVLWAIDPEIAMRRVAFTTVVIVTVAICVERLRYFDVVRLLLIGFGLVLLADWIAIALLPHAVHGSAELDPALVGNWRGIHDNKNEAGAFCALAIILFLHAAVRRKSLLISGPMLALSAIFLYQSQSKAALALVVAALVISAAVYGAYRSRAVRQFEFIVLGAMVIPGCLVFLEEIGEHLTTLLEDPASLTGRAQIWPVLFDYAEKHPFLGSGFGSFWGLGAQSATRGHNIEWIAELYTAHNGYLELLVQVGGVGLIIAVACLILHPLKLIMFTALPGTVSRSLICSILVFGWLRDIFESSLLDRANPTWTIMVVMYCVLYKYSETRETAPLATTLSRREHFSLAKCQ